MLFKTADLYDAHAQSLAIATPGFLAYGRIEAFYGRIATVKVHEDNVLVKDMLAQPGNGQVLVVDGGGSLRCALMGDLLAQMMIDNRWAGAIIYGCIRDSQQINQMAVGVKALAAHPAKSVKRGAGTTNEPVSFCGISFHPNHYVYSDADGIMVSAQDVLV